jgi:hypothetical protein
MTRAPKHPGKTAAQRRVLDAIGCGQFSPRMSKATRDAMLTAGLIEPAGFKLLAFKDGFPPMRIPEYAMPIPVHMQWCEHCAATEPDPT